MSNNLRKNSKKSKNLRRLGAIERMLADLLKPVYNNYSHTRLNNEIAACKANMERRSK